MSPDHVCAITYSSVSPSRLCHASSMCGLGRIKMRALWCQLNEVGKVHGHFIDLCRIVLLNIAQNPDIIGLDKVDRHTFAAVATGTTDAVDVELTVVGQIVVDHQRHLGYIKTTCPDISGNEHTARAPAEFAHDGVTLALRHIAVHRGHSKVSLAHLVSEPVNLPLRVAEDNSLSDCEGVVKITEGVEFPLLTFHRHKKLLDALERQFVTLDEHTNRFSHEFLSHFEHFFGQRC
mmetsp:Transcript_88339/g.142961  ORF Transcript_88339/g.142961 Transcript_88339/m.142961 type:complete len:234 (-) Transcript_88339:621-1322(-)